MTNQDPNQTPDHSANPEPNPTPSRRGGKRPGAGAPKGNLNAFKHGRRSRQMAEIGTLVSFNPKVADAINHHNQRAERATQTATQHAFDVVTGLYKHAKEIAMGIDNPGPFRHLLTHTLPDGLNAIPKPLNVQQSIGSQPKKQPKTPRPSTNRTPTHPPTTPENEFHPHQQSATEHNPQQTTKPQTRNPID